MDSRPVGRLVWRRLLAVGLASSAVGAVAGCLATAALGADPPDETCRPTPVATGAAIELYDVDCDGVLDLAVIDRQLVTVPERDRGGGLLVWLPLLSSAVTTAGSVAAAAIVSRRRPGPDRQERPRPSKLEAQPARMASRRRRRRRR
jgi:hypothetical protein